MSVEALLWAIHKAPTDDAMEALALIVMGDVAHDEGRRVYLSTQNLGTRMRVSRETAKRVLDRLERKGLIVPGDQQIVAHFRADRRPKVWDLAVWMTKESAGASVENTGGHADPPLPPRVPTGGQIGGLRGVTLTPNTRTNPSTKSGGSVRTDLTRPRETPPVENPPQIQEADSSGADAPRTTCARHEPGHDAPCGPCGDARKAYEAEQRRVKADRERQRLDAERQERYRHEARVRAESERVDEAERSRRIREQYAAGKASETRPPVARPAPAVVERPVVEAPRWREPEEDFDRGSYVPDGPPQAESLADMQASVVQRTDDAPARRPDRTHSDEHPRRVGLDQTFHERPLESRTAPHAGDATRCHATANPRRSPEPIGSPPPWASS